MLLRMPSWRPWSDTTEVDARAIVTSDIRRKACDWARLPSDKIEHGKPPRQGRLAANESVMPVQKVHLLALLATNVRQDRNRLCV
jgi:hypothetical protein